MIPTPKVSDSMSTKNEASPDLVKWIISNSHAAWEAQSAIKIRTWRACIYKDTWLKITTPRETINIIQFNFFNFS